jgi:hypothetical protein
MKKNIILLLCLTLFSLVEGFSQNAPQGFNYQSVVRNAAGSAHANQTVTMLFAIRSGAANGQVIYTERHITNTNEYGLVNIVVGRGEVLQGSFSTINWGGGPKYLTASVETSPNVFEELGSTELLSVPFALYAQNGGGGGGGGNDDWGTQTAVTDATLKGNGTGGNPLGIAGQNADVGQVLKWNGTTWTPQNDITSTGQNGGTITQINTTNGITGGPITTTGTLGLSNTGVVPGPYGSASQIPVITVDAQGRISNVFTVVPSPGTINITGGAGIAVQPNGINFTISNTGDVNPGDDITTSTNANGDVSGIFSNLQIKNDVIGSAELSDNSVGANELIDGAVGNAELAANAVATANLQNGAVTAAKLNAMGAVSGQILKWNGTAWVPAADQTGTLNLTGGAGITISGTAPNLTIANTGDANPADDITTATLAAGDVTGLFSNLQIAPNAVGTPEIANNAVTTAKIIDGAITTPKVADGAVTTPKVTDAAITTPKIANQAVTAAKIDDMGATSGQVLKWNGTIWAPATDAGGISSIVAGVGIGVFVNGTVVTIANLGDDNIADDIINTSTANGDITGVFSNLQLKPGVVGNGELSPNAVAGFNIIPASVEASDLANMGAAIGQVLTYNGTAWAPATPASGAGDNWGTQSVNTTTTLSGNGTVASPLTIAAQGATSGQVLTYNGTTWVPTTPPSGGAGDNWGTQTVTTSAVLSGNGTAAMPLTLATQSATNGQVLKFNGTTWVPAADNDSPADNWGTQVVATNATLTGNGTAGNQLRIAPQGATSGQVLKFNGTTWLPAADNDTPADNWGTQSALVGNALTGNGSAGNALNLAQQGATTGQTLKWDGAKWAPADDLVGTGSGGGNTYASGTGISITGTAPNLTINNTGDLNATNEIQTLSLAGNALSLSLGGGTVTLPSSGGSTYTSGAGINITGVAPNQTIVNTGDLSATNELQTIALSGNTVTLSNSGGSFNIDPSATNEIQTLSLTGNTLALSQGGGSVTLPTGNTYTAGTAISITGTAPNQTINNTGDPSSTNELQNLMLNGTTLKITGTNSTVKLDTILTGAGLGLWAKTLTDDHIYNKNLGNVGINTNKPIAKLHIKGGTEIVRLEGSSPQMTFSTAPTGVDGYVGLRAGYMIVGTRDSSSIALVTAQDGKGMYMDGLSSNVSIGGVGGFPHKLKVIHDDYGLMLENSGSGHNWEFWVADNGTLALYNDQTLGGAPAGVFAINGNYSSSDRRLKKNISNMPSVLSKLNQLEPVKYRFNQESDTAPLSLGLIAQDVQALFPELVAASPVRKNGEGGTLMVNYTGLGVIAVKAIQEQQVQIDQLKSENAYLRTRLDAIEALLNIKK